MGEDRKMNVEHWFFLRLAATTMVLAFGVGLLVIAADGVPARALLACVAVSVATVVGSVVAVLAGVSRRRVQALQLVVDVLVIAFCVHLSGGLESRVGMLYFLPLAFAAYDLGQRAALVTAGASALSVLAYSVIVAADRLHPPAIVYRVGVVDHGDLVESQVLISLLLVVGYLAGEMAGRLDRKAQALIVHNEDAAHLERETRSILDNMGSGVLTLDRAGRVCRVNPAAERILGLDADALVERPLSDAIGGIMPIFVGSLMECLLEGKRSARAEIHIERLDGSVVPLGLSVNPLLDATEERCGVVAVFQDLSAAVEMRDRVRNQDRLVAMGELSATIAHEIRNPLASIRGSLELLEGEIELEGENARLFDLIHRESARLNRMIEDFLEYARLRSPQPRNCEVRVLIEHIETLVQNRSDLSADATLEFTPLQEDVVVHVDEELIAQVFLNLALNAFEAMGRSGKLTVAVNVRPQLLPPDVVVRFMDEGPGIDTQLVDKIFEPFFTTKTHGTGLGLPLASRVVANHGGCIRARNLDGGGAEFSVHLPLAGVLRDGHLLEGDAGLAALERPAATQT